MIYSQFVVLFIELIALLIGLKYWKKIEQGYKIAVAQLAVTLLVECIGRTITYFHLGTNAWLFNIYALIETILLFWMFSAFSEHPKAKQFSAGVVVLMIIAWLFAIFSNGILLFSNWYVIAESLLAVIAFTFLLISNSVFSKSQLFTQPLFLLCIAIIIYYASVIPLFGVLNHLVEVDRELANNLFYINKAAAGVRYVLIGTALYLHGRNAVEDAHQ